MTEPAFDRPLTEAELSHYASEWVRARNLDGPRYDPIIEALFGVTEQFRDRASGDIVISLIKMIAILSFNDCGDYTEMSGEDLADMVSKLIAHDIHELQLTAFDMDREAE